MGSLSEILRRLEESRQRRAAWAYIAEHLFEFGGDDAIDPTRAIQADGCVSKIVPKELVREIIEGIKQERIIPLEEEIAELENIKIAETKNVQQSKAATSAKPDPGKKDAKRVRIVPSSPKAGAGGNNQTS